MPFDYRNVSLMSNEGITLAERLKEEGWRIISSSPFTLIFEIETFRYRAFYKGEERTVYGYCTIDARIKAAELFGGVINYDTISVIPHVTDKLSS